MTGLTGASGPRQRPGRPPRQCRRHPQSPVQRARAPLTSASAALFIPAIENLERATFFNFRYIQAFANLANAYLMKGMVDQAIEAAQKAMKPLLGIPDEQIGRAHV